MLLVHKRDGTSAPFDILKIAMACQKAASAAQIPNPSAVALAVASEVEELCRHHLHNILDIPTIQQYVEDALMRSHPEVARLYMGFGAQWNSYGKLNITVPLRPKPQLLQATRQSGCRRCLTLTNQPPRKPGRFKLLFRELPFWYS